MPPFHVFLTGELSRFALLGRESGFVELTWLIW